MLCYFYAPPIASWIAGRERRAVPTIHAACDSQFGPADAAARGHMCDSEALFTHVYNKQQKVWLALASQITQQPSVERVRHRRSFAADNSV